MSNPPSAPCGATGANPPVADLANVPKMWGRRQISQMSHLSHPKKCDIPRHSRHLACPIFRAKPEARQPAASVSLPVPLIYCSTVLARPWRAGGAAHLKKPRQTTPNHAKSRQIAPFIAITLGLRPKPRSFRAGCRRQEWESDGSPDKYGCIIPPKNSKSASFCIILHHLRCPSFVATI